ncbi:ZP1 protein, partial [Amia calva]|nr:ZP1 protein [Amia calva]
MVRSADQNDHFTCTKCVVHKELAERVRVLEEHVDTLRKIKEAENWLDSVCRNTDSTSVVRDRPTTAAAQSQQDRWGSVKRGSRSTKSRARAPAHQSPIWTANRFEPLGGASAEKVLIIGDSIVRNIKIVSPAVEVKCLPGARVSDIEAKLDELPGGEVSTLVIHTGTNDIRHRQLEILKRNFTSLCKTANKRCQNIIVSGPLPTLHRGDEAFSRLSSLNSCPTLQSACNSQHSLTPILDPCLGASNKLHSPEIKSYTNKMNSYPIKTVICHRLGCIPSSRGPRFNNLIKVKTTRQKLPAHITSPMYKLAVLNIRSLPSKAALINDTITDAHIDVLTLTETWLRPDDTIPLVEASPNDYSYCQKARTTGRGGGITYLTIFYDKLIILGDFNIHIDIKDVPLTVSFLSLLESVGFTQHVSGPTHCHNHTLDLVITRGVQIHNLIISPQNQMISDHCLITFELPGVELVTQERNIETRCLNPTAIHKFTTLLPNASFIKTGSADELLNNFNNTLSTALDTVAPLRTPTKHSPWFDEHTRSLKTECRRCERKWRETKLEYSNLIETHKNNPHFHFNTIATLTNQQVKPSEVIPKISSHIQNVLRSSFLQLRNIARLRQFLSLQDTEKLIHAFVTSRLDYCYAILSGSTNRAISALQVVGKTTIYLAEVMALARQNSLKYGVITRDGPFRLLVECRYAEDNLISTGYLVKSPNLPSTIMSPGVFGVQLRIATDAAFSRFYPQYHRPLRLLLGRPMYLEVRLLSSPDPNLLLLVHYCVAYPRSAQAVWVLLYEG